MNKPPAMLIVSFVLYMTLEIWTAISDAADRGSAVIRLSLLIAILYFAIRGSRIATNIWATLSLVGGLIYVYSILTLFPSYIENPYWFAAAALFCFINTAYFYFSNAIRTYQLQLQTPPQ